MLRRLPASLLVVLAVLTSVFGAAAAQAATYTWNGGATASWAASASWSPARTTPTGNDTLVFGTGTSVTATSIPTQSIGRLVVQNNTTVTLQPTVTATTLSLINAGQVLSVASGSALNVSGTNTLAISIATGSTGSVSGNMTFTNAAHTIVASDAGGLTFNSGAIFTQGTGSSGGAFGSTGTANTVVFANGSRMNQVAGANPFQLTQPNSKVAFQSGSTFSLQQNAAPSLSGRTYANLEFNAATLSQTVTGAAVLTVDTLRVVAGTINLNLTGGIVVKGNITNSGGSLAFNPATATSLSLLGTGATVVGPVTFAATDTVKVGSSTVNANVTLATGYTIAGPINIASGSTLATNAGLTANGAVAVNGTFQINQGGFTVNTGTGTWNYGTAGTLAYNNSSGSFGVGNDLNWPTTNGPVNVTVAGAGGITMNVARTVSGTFQTAAGVANANSLTLNGTCQINTGGFLTGAPTYGASSTLRYNSGGTYGRGSEWAVGAASNPANVQLSNNTTLNYPNGGGAFTKTITGNLTIDSGSSLFMDFGSPGTGVGALTVGGNVVQNGALSLGNAIGGDLLVGGNFTRSGTFTPNSRAVEFTGAGSHTLTGATTFDYLTISGAGGLTLANDATVNQTLALGSAVLTTGANKVAVSGAVTRSSGFVAGNLQKPVSGAGTVNFEIGSGAQYAPASIAVASVGGAGTLTATTAGGVTPPGAANLNASKFVNRSWTFTNNGITSPSYAATFNYGATELQGGASAANLIIAKNSGGTWTQPAVASRVGNSVTSVGGQSSFSDFYLGEPGVSTITASAGANGSISPSGAVSVANGANQTFTITANAGYHIADVLVDGVSVGALGTYTFTNVTVDHTIAATFAIDTYTITASAGANGSIAPNGVTTVNSGASQSYTITPNAGYLVQDLLVDGVSVGALTSYTFTNVTANHTIAASFVVDPTSTVSAASPGVFVTTVNPTVSVPVTLSRTATTPILGFSVDVTLSAGLTTSAAAITEGGFLTASGGTTNFQITDNGGGHYTIDGVTLGVPCGSTATSGTLFTIGVGSTLTGGTGTVTIDAVRLRDCDNNPLASAIGTAASVDVDRSTPSIAVTSPNGGESWVAGSVHAITWTATDTEGIAANSIVLEYSVNNGSSWLPVASGLSNSGTFNWTVPNSPTASALVRASATDIHANVASDASDAVFTIQGTTTTTLASAPNPSVVGESVTLTATVSPSAATGSVEFFDGAVSLGLGTLSGGTATLSTSTLAVGPHSLTAVYGGETLYAGSTSAATTQTVNAASTTTAVSSTPNPSVFGQSVTLSASVAVNAPGAGTATGSVEFFDGALSLGTATLSGGSASISTSALSTGAHSITVVYAGVSSFSGSTSAAYTHTVNQASTSTTLASSVNPSQVGQSTTLTATVVAVAPGTGTPGGSVEFFDGAASLGVATLSGGSASISTSTLAVGTHSLTASYLGATDYTSSTSSAVSQVVEQGSTTTTVSSTPNPSAFGQSVAITVSVAANPPAAGTATGSVELFDGATSLGVQSLSGGSATFNTAALTTGAHTLSAVYAGNTDFTGSTSANYTHTVNAAATATTVTSAPNPSLFGESVTLTASVVAVAPGAGTPSGSVEFFDGLASLGTGTLSGGTATLSTSTLAVGSHSITASYLGATDYTASTSAAHTHTVNAAASSVTVSTSPNPSAFGQSVAISATLSPSAATGSVEFFDGAISLGSASLSGGSASISTSALSTGAHSITAVYAGDGSYSGSTSAAHTHTVNPASTSTSLASSVNPSQVGQSTTLTATVVAVAPGTGTPGGSVEFFDGAASLGVATLSGGSASISTSTLAVGTHSLTASYLGATDYTSSTSSAVSQVVQQGSTTTTVSSTPNPSAFGQSVAITVSVAANPPAAGTATGSVELFDGATSLGVQSLSGGSATFNTAALTTGAHTLSAVYAGNTDFTGSTSANYTHTVNAATTATTVTSAPNPSLFGESVTLTASVVAVAPGAGTPSGSVEFFDGLASLGTGTLSGGTATLSTSTLAVGSHSITASYLGATDYTASTSAAHTHTVNTAATTVTVSTSPNPSAFGQSVAISATLSPSAATGSVEFFDGATSLGLATISSGVATLNTSALSTGSHNLTASYAGDGTYTASTSGVHSHTVNAASTTTAVSTSPNPSAFGQPVTISASVSVNAPGAGTATGSVEFFDGITSLGTAPLSSGSASIITSAFSTGAHSLTAVYSGATDYTASTSAAHSHTVNPAATATSVTSAPNPSTFGDAVTLTASVAVQAPGAGTATGSVEFFDGLASLGVATLSGGSASISTSSLAVGAHSITASYLGATDYTASTSAAHTHTVNAAASSVTVSTSPNPSVFGQSVAVSASVTPATATGSVEFFDGALSIGTATLSGGTASISTSALSTGAHSITVVYAGDGSYSGSTSAAHTHTVNQASTSTSLASSVNPSQVGQSTTLTATVVAVAPGAGTPGGSVEFFDGAASLGVATLSGGSASISTSTLAVGTHSLTASYLGATDYTSSTSSAVSQVVQQGSTTTTVSSTPNPSTFGQSVAITVSVAANPPAAGTATGSVELFDGATSLGVQSLSGGSATFNTAALTTGAHTLSAVYAGNTDFTGSTSANYTHTVNPAASSVAVSTSPNASAFGQSVAVTASVTPATATGSVEFFDGLASLGTATVSGGSASINTAALAVGGHSITAVFSGDADYSGSTSAAHTHTVNAASTSTTIASDLNPSAFGQLVTFTASVSVVAPGAGTPSGTVTFFDGASSIGTGTLSGGTATFATSALAAGTHSITASYGGDGSFTGSTSAVLSQVVNAAATSVTLTATPNPGVYQDNTTLTATVSPSVATGSVEYFDGLVSLGLAPVTAGTAVLITNTLSVDVHSLTAVYSGDGSYAGATSAAVSLEIQAKIVATAGPNGSITPSGTTLYSLGATPSFTFTADPGYHVASVTVDGGAAPLTSPYTFGPVSSNHTIDVQFAVNPAVAAITTLSATQVRTGNDTDGNTKITLSWSPAPVGSTVEVWRKGYGNYPEYDDGPSPGSVPPAPASYPPAGWTLTSVIAPGTTDEPSSRDFYYYVAYVVDQYGTRSDVSNRTNGTLNYHLGDVSDGSTPGQGDNSVAGPDLSVLGAHYGITGSAVDAFNYLDVGPTTSLSVHARPSTDNKINFEDLVMFAINYSPVTSAPQAKARPAAASADALTLSVGEAKPGETLAAKVAFTGTGRLQAIAVKLSWDPAVVEPVSYTAGDLVLAQGGVVFSAEPGSVDGASFAGAGQGLVGDGEFATVQFRVKAAGDPKIAFARVEGRDAQNQSIDVNAKVAAVTPRTFATAFAPAMPNPFNQRTTFRFSLARAGRAELQVFSVDGRLVRTLSTGVREAGEYQVEWNGSDDSGRPLNAGVYYARLQTAQGHWTRVVTYLK